MRTYNKHENYVYGEDTWKVIIFSAIFVAHFMHHGINYKFQVKWSSS